MQVKISDMLDNASELIEENREIRYSVNNDRIKKIVFSEINYVQRKHKKEVYGSLNAVLGQSNFKVL